MTGRRMVRCIRLLAVSAAVVCLGVWSGAGSILDSQAQESGAYGKTQSYNKDKNYEKDQNHKEARRLFDEADLITSEEAGKLEELIARCRKKTGMDVAVVTAYNDGSHTASEYADDFYDQNGLGTGRKASGVLFLIYMDRPGSYGGEGYVSTTGNMIRILTDQRIEQIQDDVAYSLKTRDYAGAAAEFLKDVEYYVDRGIQRGRHGNRGNQYLQKHTLVRGSVCIPGVSRGSRLGVHGSEAALFHGAHRAGESQQPFGLPGRCQICLWGRRR